MTPRRWLLLLVVLGLAAFAAMGGEYSTPAWLTLRREEGQERRRIATLEREVDSLRRLLRAIETDPATQERIARERYGMLRPGEHAFVFEEPREPEP